MTAYSVEELVEEALKNTAYTCLYKPLDMDKIAALVREISRGREKNFEKVSPWR